MEQIDDRFFITKNGILFDTESNMAIEPKSKDLFETIAGVKKFNEDLNASILNKSNYSDGANFAININLTSACNLNCTYCFAKGGDYGSQKDNMSDNILPVIRELVLKNVTNSKKVRFEYFGGEPLLNESMIASLVQFSKKLEQETGIHILHRISTNLTVLTEKMLKIICDNNFVVSVSIDGKKEVQDSQRPSRNSESSYEIILNNVKRIKQLNPNIKTVARMTIAQNKVTIYENVLSLVNTNLFDYVSIYPASVLLQNGKYKYYFDEIIKKQYEELFENYNKLLDLSSVFRGVLEIEKTLEEILCGKLSINHCSAGVNYCTICSDGSIVTCHRMCGDASYIMNTKGISVLKNELRKEWFDKVSESNLCSKCFAKYICAGGCKQDHISATGNISEKNTNACEYRKFFIEQIISNIELLSRNYNERFVSLDDMFVYCGRPVVKNNREYPQLEKDVKIYVN